MVTRVSTNGNYASVLTNLMSAQSRLFDANERVSSEKNGSNLKDYANKAETLAAMRVVDRRTKAYQDQNGLIADKLSNQDQALNQVADAAGQIRQTIADALATDRADTLMTDLNGLFKNAIQGMNTSYDGKYLFAGGQINTQPVTATSMADLTAGPAIASFFQNDQFKAQAKLDDSTSVTTGFLANDIGTPLMSALQAIQAYSQGPNGPFTGQLTDAQRTFLQGVLPGFDTVRSDLTLTAAQNGLTQKRVDDVASSLVGRKDTLTVMIGDITGADMGKAASDLAAAQLAVQASAKVFQSLQNSSLLNFL
ncbi:MAG: flagellin [Phenylobacterium sp.]|nr:flagellin [Phenylobacterium sp.]